ncbi:C-X-C motif chemokine 2-like isoform X2 [Marmota marmota marmota]|nr:C-X-C motif chemokine 2-like isoform X2 [Marmota marmota marmota]
MPTVPLAGGLGYKANSPETPGVRQEGQAGGTGVSPLLQPGAGRRLLSALGEAPGAPGISLARGSGLSRQPCIKGARGSPRATEPGQQPLATSSCTPGSAAILPLSPMARTASAVPRASWLLRVALLLLLLVDACRRAAGAPVVSELRCQCLQTVQGIHLKNIQSVKVTSPGPHCAQTEVIATLKNGQEACLNPEAPLVKKIIHKMLNKSSTN